MARLTYIAGKSGTGKSTSLMTLNPETTYILNADSHELPFAYTKKYNTTLGNYAEGSDLPTIKSTFKIVNSEKKFKILVIDTWSRVMTDYIMSKPFRAAPDGRKAWGKFAQDMYDLLNVINNGLREDLHVYLLCHVETHTSDTSGIEMERVSVHGKQLAAFVPESFSTVVLYSHVEVIPGQKPTYHFRTTTNGKDTCKSPIGMFTEETIPNDLQLVTNTIDNYYQ